MDFAKKHTLRLPELKNGVESWHQYFKRNNQRFWEYTKFVSATTLSNTQRTALMALNKPPLQFNIIDAMVSRLLGEFIKHSPSFEVRAADGVPVYTLTPEFTETIDIIEGHLRSMFSDATNDALKYRFYKDCIVGGFSVAEVYTDYVNSRSFEQKICVDRVFDPTLTFFDPMARLSHKGDGAFAGKLVPLSYEDFKNMYGSKAAEDIKFGNSSRIEGFNWSYQNQKENIVMVAHAFVKEVKKMRIVKLTNGHVVPEKHYEKLIEAWNEEAVMAVAPKVLQSRWTDIETISQYQFTNQTMLDRKETDFSKLPIIFIDGNSALIRGADAFQGIDTAEGGADEDGQTVQFTKPYIMHAKDMQLMMNFAGQSLAAEMENIVQHQYIASAESIPEDYQEAYTNPQLANVLVWNELYDKDPSVRLTPPQVLQRRAIPPELSNTFNGAVQHIQSILGTYEASLGINDKQLSGVAIQQGALQSNAAALPYLMGWTNGMSRIAEIVVDLIPKYYRTPRTLPVIKGDGKRDYQVINTPGVPHSVRMDYDPNNLQIKVEMGVSAAVQKQVSMEMINSAMASNPDFAAFFGQMGLETYLDNMDIRGIDHLKEQAAKYMEMKQQQQEQASQQPSPEQVLVEGEKEIAFAQVEQKREQAQGEQVNKTTELAIKKQEADMKFVELLAKIEAEETKSVIDRERMDAENARSAVEMAIDMIDNVTTSRTE